MLAADQKLRTMRAQQAFVGLLVHYSVRRASFGRGGFIRTG